MYPKFNYKTLKLEISQPKKKSTPKTEKRKAVSKSTSAPKEKKSAPKTEIIEIGKYEDVLKYEADHPSPPKAKDIIKAQVAKQEKEIEEEIKAESLPQPLNPELHPLKLELIPVAPQKKKTKKSPSEALKDVERLANLRTY